MISIIIPTYNNAQCLQNSINSVFNQTSNIWELIIINDGSTDETETIIKNFSGEKEIKYFVQKNSGVSSARNYGVSMAKGDYILFLDADDELYPEVIENFTNILRNNKNLGICSGAYWNNLEFVKKYPRNKGSFFHNFCLNILAGSCIIKKTLFEEAGGYDIRITHSENWELFIRLTAICKKKKLDVRAYKFLTFKYNDVLDVEKTVHRTNNIYESFKILYFKYKLQGHKDMRFHCSKVVASSAYQLGLRKEAIKWQLKAIYINPFNLESYLKLGRNVLF